MRKSVVSMKIKEIVHVCMKAIYNSNARFFIKSKFGLSNNVPDEEYLKQIYKFRMGKELKLENPITFNEKLQWLKLNDRRPEYTMMVDKYEVKKYVANVIGEEYIIPTLGVWNNVDEIDFSSLPSQFVLKCTHDSGSLVICKDKKSLDIEKAKEKLSKWLKRNLFWYGREWPYKNVKPRIIAEQYMTDKTVCELRDYKIHCFNGMPKFVLVCSERFSENGIKEDFLDINWNKLPFKRPQLDCSEKELAKPIHFDKMLKLSEILSKNIPFIRCDFYEINSKVYFGELTFYPASGFEAFEPEEWDHKLGSWLELPKKY